VVHQLITIAEPIGPDDSMWRVFDRKLEEALHAVEVAVSIRLRAEMGHGIELVRWLEWWTIRFKDHQKTLLCIAEDPQQRQCIELSHPNMELLYISSLNEIPKFLLHLTKPKEKIDAPPVTPIARKDVVPEKKETEQPIAAPQQQTASAPISSGVAITSPSDNAIDKSGKESDKLPNAVRLTISTTKPIASDNRVVYGSRQVKQNTVIEISGEYRCDCCGTIRMFCKGDVVNKCENRECFSVEASFSLQFDLF
jgi:hypothetical protein